MSVATELAQRAVNGQALLGRVTACADWVTIADSWNRLHLDEYMADGGKYRFRRYSEVDLDLDRSTLTLRRQRPFSQSREVNHLNGGIDRQYTAIEADIATSAGMRELLEMARPLLHVRGHRLWRAQCFQNRIIASPHVAGQPAPEGAHRDGVEVVLTVLVARHNAAGGESQVIRDDGTLLLRATLTEPGEFIVIDDDRLLHDVTPIVAQSGARSAHRDVLVAMFSPVIEIGA